MHDLTALQNRIRKNQRSLASWVKQHNISCYRLYDHDIPELRYIIDRYGDNVVVYDKYSQTDEAPEQEAAAAAIIEALGLGAGQLYYKERRRMAGDAQYEKISSDGDLTPVNEGTRRYYINLTDYLDTGLFLDHRPIRDRFQKTNAGRFLNLFSYTGSVSVAAALGGATTTSVDMSNRYVGWTEDNFRLNALDLSKHRFVREDALKFLKTPGPLRHSFDTIFLDPPTFSNSKKMTGSFDVQRDHVDLIENTMQFLAPGGRLFFSCNRHKFRIDPVLSSRYRVHDMTAESIPRDFRNQKVHVCFEIQALEIK